MPRRPTKPKWNAKDVSPVGWYIAAYIERLEFKDEDKPDLTRRCRAWKNTILVRARDPEQAYRRARYWATLGGGGRWKIKKGIRGRMVFEGFTTLLPVYDKIKDGCEVIWTDYRSRSVRSIKSMVSPKGELEVFRDYKNRHVA